MAFKVHSTEELRRQMAAAQNGTPMKMNSNKFNAVATKTDLGSFDSGHEAGWAEKLQTLLDGGYIENLELDKRKLLFALDVNSVRICQYEADARFDVVKEFRLPTHDGLELLRAGRHCVLDAKSPPTRKKPAYIHKRNLMLAVHNIKILEV